MMAPWARTWARAPWAARFIKPFVEWQRLIADLKLLGVDDAERKAHDVYVQFVGTRQDAARHIWKLAWEGRL